MKIKYCGIFVEDQQKALDFYTGIVGFQLKDDVPVGEYRWITVTSPESGDTEFVLEPNANPAAKTYQEAIYSQGIPATALEVDDIAAEFERLSGQGVQFKTEPTEAGPVKIAVFDDTCGNYIQIIQHI